MNDPDDKAAQKTDYPEEESATADRQKLSAGRTLLNKLKFLQRFGPISFLVEWIRRMSENRVSLVGAQLAYYLMLSFFPFTIFLLSIFSYSRFGSEEILANQLALLPEASSNFLTPILLNIVRTRSTALLSTSLFLALWSSSTGIKNLINEMSRIFNQGQNKRPFWRTRLVAAAATVLIVVLMILILASQVFGNVIYNYLSRYFSWSEISHSIWDALVTYIPLVILSLGLAMLYRYGPYFEPGCRLSFRKAWVSGGVAAVSWVLISYLFRIYVNNFANYANVYGSLVGIILLLFWLYLSAVVIMAGSVFASVWQERSRRKMIQ
jgi:membrane protein